MISRFCVIIALTLSGHLFAQCDSVDVYSDMTITSDLLMSGTYVIEGTFTIQSGITVYVTPYSSNGCGELKIYADNIIINGKIDGNYAGYEGGSGGSKGQSVSSLTGHATSLTTCADDDSQGHISVEGGIAGQDGTGPGAGIAGANGLDGSGSKQYCGNLGDEAGLIGGAGGAGGGSGGAYGGEGANASNGGNGANTGIPSDIDVENSYASTAGTGGVGGAQSNVYGTLSGRDIQLGSGGAGAGGGGRSFYLGSDGVDGGAGGGLILLRATQDILIDGEISANGQDGSLGGNGGAGDATDDCCSDGCSGCDERTFSCGSGSGAGSGGGSGGGIFIECYGLANIQGTLIARGGNGGQPGQKGNGATCSYGGGVFCSSNNMTTSDGDLGGQGGSGGGGRIKIYVSDCAQPNLLPTVEINGGTGDNNGTEGTYSEVCGYVGIESLPDAILWTLYPNPFEGNVHVQLPASVNYTSPAEIMLYDEVGKMVGSYSINQPSADLNLTSLHNGIYFVQLQHNGHSSMRKISKR